MGAAVVVVVVDIGNSVEAAMGLAVVVFGFRVVGWAVVVVYGAAMLAFPMGRQPLNSPEVWPTSHTSSFRLRDVSVACGGSAWRRPASKGKRLKSKVEFGMSGTLPTTCTGMSTPWVPTTVDMTRVAFSERVPTSSSG